MSLKLSWDTVMQYIENLANSIEIPEPNFIGVYRGGVIPAMLLQQRLHGTCRTLYPDENLDQQLEQLRHIPNKILVDDICDSGKTLGVLTDIVNMRTAALIHKPNDLHDPIYYGREITGDEWIVFPWEYDDSVQVIQ